MTRRIADIRRAKGLTQDELAEALSTATRNVQRIEAGQNLTLHTIARIAAVFGMRPEELLIAPEALTRPPTPRRPARSRRPRTEPRAYGPDERVLALNERTIRSKGGKRRPH